ncbi:conserved hypothetical protein [Ricinus communis]|uniref:Uncharacterized protein n=1 Tax=Ricinus communis TaxID=3988 RepID=B9TPX1_RICCO|nr:conserved hypothetical protein [Ricinus communis]
MHQEVIAVAEVPAVRARTAAVYQLPTRVGHAHAGHVTRSGGAVEQQFVAHVGVHVLYGRLVERRDQRLQRLIRGFNGARDIAR